MSGRRSRDEQHGKPVVWQAPVGKARGGLRRKRLILLVPLLAGCQMDLHGRAAPDMGSFGESSSAFASSKSASSSSRGPDVLVKPPAALRHERPSVVSAHLQLQPGQTATERALELKDRLTATQAEQAALARRIGDLEEAVKVRDSALIAASAEINAAREQLVKSQSHVEQIYRQNRQLREQYRKAKMEELNTLQGTMSLLREVAESPPPAESAVDSKAADPVQEKQAPPAPEEPREPHEESDESKPAAGQAVGQQLETKNTYRAPARSTY